MNGIGVRWIDDAISRASCTGLSRAAQIIKCQLDIRVIDRSLENLAIHLEESGPDWFGLLQRLTDRPLKEITLYRALDSHE